MDWFIELKKKRDKSINQNEDYLSIVFAGIIQTEQKLTKYILNYLFRQSKYKFENPKFEVQKIIDNGRADIFISDNNKTFGGIIECKLEASYELGQLKKYDEYLKKNYKKCQVVYLGIVKPDNEEYERFDWFEVYKLMEDYLEKEKINNEILRYIFEEYKKLLRNLKILIDPINLAQIIKSQKIGNYNVPIELGKITKCIYYHLVNIKQKLIINNKTKNNILTPNGREDWFEITLDNINNTNIVLRLFLGYKYPEKRGLLNILIYITNYPENIKDILVKNNFIENDKLINEIGGVGNGRCKLKIIEKSNIFWKLDLKGQENYIFNEIINNYYLLKNLICSQTHN
jgi:hypothetical protein